MIEPVYRRRRGRGLRYRATYENPCPPGTRTAYLWWLEAFARRWGVDAMAGFTREPAGWSFDDWRRRLGLHRRRPEDALAPCVRCAANPQRTAAGAHGPAPSLCAECYRGGKYYRPARPASKPCAWCGARFELRVARGRIPSSCSPRCERHRRAAYIRERRAAERACA